jgi:hypothetical protein
VFILLFNECVEDYTLNLVTTDGIRILTKLVSLFYCKHMCRNTFKWYIEFMSFLEWAWPENWERCDLLILINVDTHIEFSNCVSEVM